MKAAHHATYTENTPFGVHHIGICLSTGVSFSLDGKRYSVSGGTIVLLANSVEVAEVVVVVADAFWLENVVWWGINMCSCFSSIEVSMLQLNTSEKLSKKDFVTSLMETSWFISFDMDVTVFPFSSQGIMNLNQDSSGLQFKEIPCVVT